MCHEEIGKEGGSQKIKDEKGVKYLGYTCWGKKNGNGNLLVDFGINFIHYFLSSVKQFRPVRWN
jgi:hypothetical protein